jgi:putative transposase
MKKRYTRKAGPTMRRSARVFLNDLNDSKTETLKTFLHQARDITHYFVDVFWHRQDFSASLADLPTIHCARDRFGISVRLAQALAKQAKECNRSAHSNGRGKPQLRKPTVTLYSHFVTIEAYQGEAFDLALRIGGAGVPKVLVPVHSTAVINRFLTDGWEMAKTIRLGLRKGRLFVEFLFDKARPTWKTDGAIVGMDSNYKAGLVFSDGQQVAEHLYGTIQTFSKRKKHTHQQLQDLMGQALKQLDFSQIRVLCVEDLKRVKHGKRGTFSRTLNRRLSHWLYSYTADVLARHCEVHGVKLERKNPAYTSQFCRVCRTWDRRNRKGDKFTCIHCGFSDHADRNAAQNLELLGLAGSYGLRSLQSETVR